MLIRAAGPSQGANYSPSGGSVVARMGHPGRKRGGPFAPPGRPKARITPPRGQRSGEAASVGIQLLAVADLQRRKKLIVAAPHL